MLTSCAMTEKLLIATLVGALVAAVVALFFSGRQSSPLNDRRAKGRKVEGIAPSGGDAESVARLLAKLEKIDPRIEHEFNKIFMTTSKEGKENLIQRWIDKKNCGRGEAMRLAVEERRRDNR